MYETQIEIFFHSLAIAIETSLFSEKKLHYLCSLLNMLENVDDNIFSTVSV